MMEVVRPGLDTDRSYVPPMLRHGRTLAFCAYSLNPVPLPACLTQKQLGAHGMEDSGKDGWGGRIPANDNRSEREAEGGEHVAPMEKLDRVVLDITRLIGRQMAREDFARLQASAANDNAPHDGADED